MDPHMEWVRREYVPGDAFGDNGRPPEGNQVAWIQDVGSLWQRIPGFQEGKTYRITVAANRRQAAGAPELEIRFNGFPIAGTPVSLDSPAGGGNPFQTNEAFVRPGAGAFLLEFRQGGLRADKTVLLDDVQIAAAEGATVENRAELGLQFY